MHTMLQWQDRCRGRRISSSFPHTQTTYLCTNEYLTTHSVTIVSDSFESKMQPARHRMVYALLKEEMAREGGLHALQLKTQTPAEEQREKERKEKA
jgi:stress-induced morphogen